MRFSSDFKSPAGSGFTLVELSIVLVIIGLITGGVLVGRDLISAATVRSQISQIEKYNAAVNTFRGKYGYLPGDMPDPYASQYGFVARGLYAGEGDGNGVIEGVFTNAAGNNYGFIITAGETSVFWMDLAAANLIGGGSFNSSITGGPGAVLCTPGTCGIYFPSAKINSTNVAVMSTNNRNYFVLNWALVVGGNGNKLNPALTTSQAYSVDQKIDDGLPQTGNVLAMRDPEGFWAAGPDYHGAGDPPGSQTPGTANTCYDNNNVLAAVEQYSVGQNNGGGINCSLSIRFQ